MGYLVLFAGLALILVASHFISTAIYHRMAKGDRKAAIAVRVVAFIASFLVITLVIFYLILSNIRMLR